MEEEHDHTYIDTNDIRASVSSVEVTCDFPSPLDEIIHPQLGELITKRFCCCLKEINQTKPCIEKMQLLLYQLAHHFGHRRVWGLD